MTRLEEEIANEIGSELLAQKAAEVAKKYIDLALDVNPIAMEQELCGMKSQETIKQEWLKENGVI